MKPYPSSFDEMVAAMISCEQTAGQTVYQHGQSVWGYTQELLNNLREQHPLAIDRWRVPKWYDNFGSKIVQNLHSDDIMYQYTIFHDCGKPFCLTLDEQGRTHFPDHAKVSADVWEKVGGAPEVKYLIADDMAIHTLSAQDILYKMEKVWSVKDSFTLLIVALAEIHSNARMFSGMDSTNFKIKWNAIDRRGSQISKFWFGASA